MGAFVPRRRARRLAAAVRGAQDRGEDRHPRRVTRGVDHQREQAFGSGLDALARGLLAQLNELRRGGAGRFTGRAGVEEQG
ncbi:hypothetical protein ABZY36_02045 [Streptomyces sp. NPDC006627]|uniref:hypothetical protein n=1 Tax=Streptomyces sp. NPDC006627 TaxID=3154679 RepID=UPI0033A63D3A